VYQLLAVRGCSLPASRLEPDSFTLPLSCLHIKDFSRGSQTVNIDQPSHPPQPTVFWHRTRAESAAKILAGGFRDGRGTYMTEIEFEGVWISDEPLDVNDGAHGTHLLRITLPPAVDLSGFEWIEEGKGFREWCVPAHILNTHGVSSLERVDRTGAP
jgi:hypothetical protein